MSILLEANNIIKYWGDKKVLDVKSFKIYDGDRIGVVGANGSGKTTLLNILSGELSPDSGNVKKYGSIAYIHQLQNMNGSIDTDIINFKEFGVADKLDNDNVSGGEETRIKIAEALGSHSHMIFADEPTSNLDYEGINLLYHKLQRVKTFLLISHDRSILDRLCNKIAELKDCNIEIYEGNFSKYDEQRRLRRERQVFEYEQYIEEKRHLENALEERQNKAKIMKKAPKRMGNSEARLHKGKTKEKQKKLNNAQKSIETRLNKLDVVTRPPKEVRIALDFSLTDPPKNKIVVSSGSLNFSYGDKVIFKDASFNLYNGQKTAVYAPNGAGKTTLMNLILSSNQSIYKAAKVKLGYLHQRFENIDFNKSIIDNVMEDSLQNETTVRTILARLLFKNDDIYKSVGILSGGELIKLSFAKMFVSDVNVLMLDEPTNYLDMMSIESLQSMICDYEGTVVFVSHDRTFVNEVADRLLIIDNKQIISFEGSIYEYLNA